MRAFVDKIREIAERAAASIGVALIRVEYIHAVSNKRFRRKRAILQVVIHREGGTRIQDCEGVSRAIEQELDVLDLIPGRYSLEVRSKGIQPQKE